MNLQEAKLERRGRGTRVFWWQGAWKKELIEVGFSKRDIRSNLLTFEDLLSRHKGVVGKVAEILKHKFEVELVKNIKLSKRIITETSDDDLNVMFTKGFATDYSEVLRKEIIVTNSLKRVSKNKYDSNKMPLGFCSDSAFREYYQKLYDVRRFIKQNISSGQSWINALFFCLLDSRNLGARELYLGFSGPGNYQYIIDTGKVEGRLDSRVVSRLVDLIKESKSSTDVFNRIFPIESGECFVMEASSINGVNIVFKQDPPLLSTVGTNQPHILLIDDDENFVNLLKKVLVAKGYKISVAVSVNEALLYYLNSESSIDLVVTDLHLPKLGGVDLISAVKKKRDDMPIIVLTTDEATDSHLRVISAGGDILVRKSEDPKILLAWISKLLTKS